MDLNYSDFNFEHLLIKRYLNYSLNEIDLLVILKSDELINNGISIITCNILIPYFSNNISKEKIDASIAKLYKKNIFKIVEKDNKSSISIEEFKKLVILDAIKDFYLASNIVSTNDDNFFTEVEKLANKTLTIIEKEYVSRWLKAGYLQDDIIDAIKKSMLNNKKFNANLVNGLLTEENKSEENNVNDEIDTSGWMKESDK